MATKKLKKTFVLRFLGYFGIFIGFFTILFQFGPVLTSELGYRKDKLFGIQHTLSATVITSLSSGGSQPSPEPSQGQTGFESVSSSANQIVPVSTDYSIVIEKINANAKVVAQIDPANSAQYMEALSKGVAEAKDSTPPGQPGNTYIFSHSTDASWNIIRFNAVFYLLRELEPGDRIVVFYQGRRYDYIVFDKTVVEPTDVSYLTNRYDKPVLTLQTCDPPGTILRRLVVRARLASS
jgi:sortase A